MITQIITTTLIDFVKILPILLITIVVSQIIKTHIHKDKIQKTIKENEKGFAEAGIMGIMTPGPLLVYLPILKSLKDKGVPFSVLVAFITGQTLIGPGRIFLEIDYFGFKFFIYRTILALLIALGVATGFKILEKNYLKHV